MSARKAKAGHKTPRHDDVASSRSKASQTYNSHISNLDNAIGAIHLVRDVLRDADHNTDEILHSWLALELAVDQLDVTVEALRGLEVQS